MSMPLNTGSFSRLIYPGINSIFQTKYAEYAEEWPELFDQYTSKRNYEEDLALSGFGLMGVKPEMASIQFDSMRQSFTTRYTHIVYALGFQISRELMEDDLYAQVSSKKASALAFSARQTKEIIATNVYNRAFNTSYTGGDSKALMVSDHPNAAGGTYSNILSTAANISEASLEQAVIDLQKLTDDRGLRVSIKPQKLIIPVDVEFEVDRILKSTLRYGTANNDMNALRARGPFPQGIVVSHYLTSATAWFIRTNCPDSLKHFKRRGIEFTTDNDWDTENARFKATERYSFGWSDPKGIYGSAGV